MLTEVLVYRHKGDLREPVALKRARAGFSQNSFGAEQLIDGKLDPKNGWAIAPVLGESHQAYFEFGEVLDLEKPAILEIEMKHLYGGGSSVGRPRFSFVHIVSRRRKGKGQRYMLLVEKKEEEQGGGEGTEGSFLTQKKQIVLLGQKIGEAEDLLSKIKPASTLVMVEMDKKRQTRVMSRGNYLSPKQKVDANVPESLHAWNEDWPATVWAWPSGWWIGKPSGSPGDGEPLVGTTLR